MKIVDVYPTEPEVCVIVCRPAELVTTSDEDAVVTFELVVTSDDDGVATSELELVITEVELLGWPLLEGTAVSHLP